MAVTLKDVAREAGVGTTTASIALRGDFNPMVSERTRQRVLEAARRLKYRHNLYARQLARRRSEAVGIFAWNLTEGVNLARFQAVESAVRARGFRPLVGYAPGHEDVRPRSAEEFISQAVEGVIIVNAGGAYHDALGMLVERQIPIASLQPLPDVPVDVVTVDRTEGTYLAAKHLLELGHRRIAWLHSPSSQSVSFLERRDGFRKALGKHACPLDESLLVPLTARAPTDDGYQRGWLAARELLTRHPLPTAILCNNDESAIGTMKALAEAGLRVPEEMAVVGFDNIRVSAYLPVPLTTITQPVEDEVTQAAAMLFDRITNPDREWAPRMIRLKPRLIVRASCGAAAAGRERSNKQ